MSADRGVRATLCDQCFLENAVPVAKIGKRVKCRHCGQPFVVDAPRPDPKPAETEGSTGADAKNAGASKPKKKRFQDPTNASIEASAKWWRENAPETTNGRVNYRAGDALAGRVFAGFQCGAALGLLLAIGFFFSAIGDSRKVGSSTDGHGRRTEVYEVDGKRNSSFGEAILGAVLVFGGVAAAGFFFGFLVGPGKNDR